MSDIQELIHKTSMDCIDKGKRLEQERIIKLLEEQCERPLDPKWEHYRESCSCWQIELIKGREVMREPEMFTNAHVRILEKIARGLGARDETERIIKLLDEAKTYQQLERAISLIKGEQPESKSVARRVKIQKGESAKGSVEPAQLEVLIKGEK